MDRGTPNTTRQLLVNAETGQVAIRQFSMSGHATYQAVLEGAEVCTDTRQLEQSITPPVCSGLHSPILRPRSEIHVQ
jgi:hypothetical protein